MGGANAFRPMFRSYQNVAQVQAPDLTTVLDNVLNNAITRENTQANIDKLKYDLEFARQADPLRLKTAAAELDKLVMENNSYNDRLASELGLRNAQTEHYKATTANIPIENEQKWAQIRNQGASNGIAARELSMLEQSIGEKNRRDDLRNAYAAFKLDNPLGNLVAYRDHRASMGTPISDSDVGVLATLFPKDAATAEEAYKLISKIIKTLDE